MRNKHRDWVATAINTIEADFNRSADTHLIPVAKSMACPLLFCGSMHLLTLAKCRILWFFVFSFYWG